MDIRPIRTEEDLRWALSEVERYFDNEPALGTPEADRFDVLSDLIEAYEAKHYPMGDIDPIDALNAFMEMTGRAQKDLATLLDSAPRASEILNRKRALTIEMIDLIAREWKMPIDLLAHPYPLARAA